jgi:hypothetical protein
LHSYARQEFERHREVSDLVRSSLLSVHPYLFFYLIRRESLIIANNLPGPYSVLVIGMIGSFLFFASLALQFWFRD